jgi:hypothetical protein
MLRPSARFREVAIRIFDLWVLIAVPKLLGETEIPVVMMFFFRSALSAVGIVLGDFIHNQTPA